MPFSKIISQGVVLALLGVFFLIPDALTIRLIESAPVLGISFLRALGVGLSIPLFYAVVLKKNILKLDQGEEMKWRLITALLFAVNHFTFTYAVENTTVAAVLSIIATTPLIAAIISIFFLKESPSFFLWLVTIPMVVAIAAIGFEDILAGQWDGTVLALIAVINLSFALCVFHKYPKTNAMGSIAYSGIIGVVVFIFFYNPISTPLLSHEILPALVMMFLVQPLGLGLLSLAARTVSPPQVSLTLLLETVFGPLLVWIAIGESPGQKTIYACIVIIITVSIYCIHKMLELSRKNSSR